MLGSRFSSIGPAALLAALIACGNSDDDRELPTSAADYCEAIEPFFCSFYLRCGRMDVTSAEDCRTAFLTSCNGVYEPRYVELEAAGLLELDVEAIDECRAHLEAVDCNRQIQELDGPCANMWRGLQSAGQSCGLDVEFFVCAPQTECVLGLDFCGECRPLVPLGEPCTAGDNTCGTDAFCDDGLCRARVANGDPCGADDRCMTGSLCESGVCTPPVFVERGQACDQRRRCPYLTACIGGVCTATAGLGEACGDDTGCELGYCDGTCQPPQPSGAPCDRASQCSSGLCDGQSCQSRPSMCIAER